MLAPFLDDPLFEGIPRPGLTGSPGLTDITFAGQRHVMPLRRLVEKATGRDGISQQEEQEMGFFSKSTSGSGRPAEERAAADKKWRALRESGYKGPVDHNGNAVEDMDQWIKDHSG